MNLRRFIGIIAAASSLGLPGALSQSYIWTGLGPDTNWTTALNWNLGVPNQGSGTNLFFGNLIPYTSTVDTNYTVGNTTVIFLSADLTLNSSASSVLTLDGTFWNFSANTVAINVAIAGPGGFQLAGSGTTIFGSTNNTYIGSTTLSSGTMTDAAANTFSPNSTVVLSGSAVLDSAFNETIGGLQGSGGTVTLATSGKTLTLNTSANPIYSGTIVGPGSLFIGGSGTQTLSGLNTYSGGTTVQTELFVGSSTNGSPSTFTAGPVGTGTLTFVDNLTNPSEFSPSANVTIANPIVFNTTTGDVDNDDGGNFNMTLTGLITGPSGFDWCTPGILELTGANTFQGGVDMREGTLLLGSSSVGPPAGITSGPIGTGGLILDTGTELAAALPSVTLANPINLTGNTQIGAGPSDGNALTLSGVITGNGAVTFSAGPTGTLTLSGANSYNGDTTIDGGTLIAANSLAFGSPSNNVNLNGGGLDVASGVTISNNLNTTASGNTVSGSGTIGTRLTIDGQIDLSPGDPLGTLTFSNGLKFARNGTLTLKLYDASGGAGAGFGAFAVTAGNLNITASSGSFTLNVTTIDALGNPAQALNFNSGNGYSWMFGTANNVLGFNASDFTINTTGFQNATSGGLFSISNAGNNLFLNFTPVPEPSTWALTALGIAVLTPFAISRRRRRRLVRA